MKKPAKIITPAGQAHHDDLLAVALVLGRIGPVSVERRNPTEKELDSSDVMVIDVGHRYDPELLNFDHHQWKPDASSDARSSLALVAAHLGLDQALSERPWYRFVNRMDVLGPTVVAKELGLESLPRELHSPIDTVLLDEFSAGPDEWTISTLERIGKKIASDAVEMVRIKKDIREKAELVTAAKLRGIRLDKRVTEGLESRCWLEVIDDMDAEHGPLAFSLSADQRGEGLALYRLNDNAALDLSLLKEEKGVVFAHPGGFVAKFAPDVDAEHVLELIGKARTDMVR